MNSETVAPSGMSPPSMPTPERPGGEHVRFVDRAAGREDAHDIEVGECHDQREQRRDRDDVAHHRQRHEPHALPEIGAVDCRGFVELLGHGFQRRQIHDHEERRADPHVDQNDREARPVGVAGPGDRADAEQREDPVEGAVGRVEQPQPGERAHGGRDHPRHQQHAAPLALALGRDVVHEVRDEETDDGFEHHRRDGEDAGLLHHHPERFALEQEQEVAEPDEPLHRLVERGEVDRIERRIEHKQQDQQDQRQRHQECDRRLPLHRLAQAGAPADALLRQGPSVVQDGIDHRFPSLHSPTGSARPAHPVLSPRLVYLRARMTARPRHC